MSIEKTEGFILKTSDLRETSLIVNFYTSGFGKIKGLLKGVKKDPKKFSSSLQLFSRNEIIFYHNKNSDLHLVSHCDLIDNFNLLRNNLKKFALANYAMELIDNIVAIEDKNKDLFFLLLNFLEDLAKEKNDLDKLFCIFQIKTLDLSGFKPNIEDCVLCGKPIYIHGRFSTSFGGFICNHCIFKDASSKNVLKGTIASLRYIGNNNWENLRRFKLNAHINSEMKKLLHNFINFHVERKLKSREFVDMALV